MKRRILAIAVAAAAAMSSLAAQAQADYPNQAITIIVPYAPGGTTDVVGRALAMSLGKQLKQSVIVDNKPGAGGTLGVVEMMRTRPDGYRLTLVPVSVFRQPYVQKTQYDPIRDLSYIASFTAYDFILAVPADSPFKTVKDVIDHARSGKDGVDYGTPGKFTGNQVVMAQLGKAAGVSFTHVPYKGDSEATTALLGGHVKTLVSTNGILNFMETGKVRALGIAADQRPPAFANVPTFKEAGYDVVVPSPLGLAGPKGLPQAIVQKLDAAVKAALEDPEMQRVIKNYGIRTDYRDHKAYSEFAVKNFAQEKAIVQSLGLND
ncbi:tripartite tricarboxylate transporter substrate binding protein [Comamonas composti]|uniref:tripartite tricarboxylate transporter substrate binding protein n=1 Tax=Comamonas composti TaxID=408558 RepID=UPI0003FBA4E1|nr:tripartite tricarboxylate transporter substrate binding protein [Comamonas composti]